MGRIIAYFVVSGMGVIILNYARGQYRAIYQYFGIHDVIEISKNILVAISVACLCSFTLHRMDAITRGFVVIQGALSLLALVAIRLILRTFFRRQAKNARWDNVINVLVIGISPLSALYIDAVTGMGRPFLKVVGVLAEKRDVWASSLNGQKILGSVFEISRVLKVLETHGVKVGRLVIALPYGHLPRAVNKELRMIADVYDLQIEQLGEILGIPSVGDPVPGISRFESRVTLYSGVKRALDIASATLLLLFLSPVIILTSILVLIDVGWPFVFWQDRPGRYGVPFRLSNFAPCARRLTRTDHPFRPINARAAWAVLFGARGLTNCCSFSMS